jgi:hypothetical protein
MTRPSSLSEGVAIGPVPSRRLGTQQTSARSSLSGSSGAGSLAECPQRVVSRRSRPRPLERLREAAPFPICAAGVGRTKLSPTRSGPEGSSRNDFASGRSGSHPPSLKLRRASRRKGVSYSAASCHAEPMPHCIDLCLSAPPMVPRPGLNFSALGGVNLLNLSQPFGPRIARGRN